MSEQDGKADKISITSSKKEMLAAYKELQKQIEELREAEMKPEAKLKERQDKEALAVADSLSTEGIAKEIGTLKSEIGKVLAQLSDRLEEAIGKYLETQRAVEVKAQELKEFYEIEKAASSLTALLEAQKEKRQQFEAEMAERKQALEAEIARTRDAWSAEKAAHEAEVKEREAVEKRNRDRDAEEYKYRVAREKQLAKEEFEYEKARLAREAQLKREEMERDLAAREKTLKEREAELAQLREKVEGFPKALEAAVHKAVQETTERLSREAQTKMELAKRDADAEQKILSARIESLERTVKEQNAQIAKLSSQLEKAYGQVQEVAVKAIEGSVSIKALASLQPQAAEHPRRAAPEDK
ncbi:MAG: hypothetical protein FJ278_13135 [Planctomycetes bacterium]|nr:hypothetical protein [Planctomycetota bacterium]